MKARANGFDRIAAIYDLLARLVYGKSIVESQVKFLNRVQHEDKVLILGGGTGWIVRELKKRRPFCKIWYVESSRKMLEKAKRKNGGLSSIQFILGTHNNIPDIHFDVVITNFFLDLFPNEQMKDVIDQAGRYMTPKGLWLVTDFETTGKWWQVRLTRMMIFFFRNLVGIDVPILPQWRKAMVQAGFGMADEASFYGAFIRTIVFKRIE